MKFDWPIVICAAKSNRCHGCCFFSFQKFSNSGCHAYFKLHFIVIAILPASSISTAIILKLCHTVAAGHLNITICSLKLHVLCFSFIFFVLLFLAAYRKLNLKRQRNSKQRVKGHPVSQKKIDTVAR